MKTHNKISKAITILSIVFGLIYLLIIYLSPLPKKVIDTDNSGKISIAELIAARDIGVREVFGKPNCKEYYWLKDGLLAYEKCTNNTAASVP